MMSNEQTMKANDPAGAVTYANVGRSSYSFIFDSMEVALVKGKTKARHVWRFLIGSELDGKDWREVQEMVAKYRADNGLTLDDPTPPRVLS